VSHRTEFYSSRHFLLCLLCLCDTRNVF